MSDLKYFLLGFLPPWPKFWIEKELGTGLYGEPEIKYYVWMVRYPTDIYLCGSKATQKEAEHLLERWKEMYKESKSKG